ncbi:hypothetical protein DY000_02042791 [Brassica cretica]|uniref:Uncharacterized protein n=1 Tax=Brassica cretica TaxID=69181 RepID=A0ABQ7BB11_BRACR|nr:hypothetical protein DY000_02042791 [Brassica cretica]
MSLDIECPVVGCVSGSASSVVSMGLFQWRVFSLELGSGFAVQALPSQPHPISAQTTPSVLSLHPGQLQLTFPDRSIPSDPNQMFSLSPFARGAHDPTNRPDRKQPARFSRSGSSRLVSSRSRLSTRPFQFAFQLVPTRAPAHVPARSSSHPFEVLLVVRFLQSTNKR